MCNRYYTQGATTQGLNRYSYCLNNPLAYTDPSGYYAYGCGQGGDGGLSAMNKELQMEAYGWLCNMHGGGIGGCTNFGADAQYGGGPRAEGLYDVKPVEYLNGYSIIFAHKIASFLQSWQLSYISNGKIGGYVLSIGQPDATVVQDNTSCNGAIQVSNGGVCLKELDVSAKRSDNNDSYTILYNSDEGYGPWTPNKTTIDLSDQFLFPGVTIIQDKNANIGYSNPITNTIVIPNWVNTPCKIHDYELHEYGHYLVLQSYKAMYGNFQGFETYMTTNAIPSMWTASDSDNMNNWYEISANQFGAAYWLSRFPNSKYPFFNLSQYKTN